MPPLPRTTPEQRQPLYEDIETLITVGFLPHTVAVGGEQFVLRSLGPGDHNLLRIRAEQSHLSWQSWAVATSIWMVNGHVLLDEPAHIPGLAQKFQALPERGRSILFGVVLGLFRRQDRAVQGVEAYCYENLSRFRWKSFGAGLPPNYSGIPGVDALGMNYVQRMWVFYNEAEDRRQVEEAQWEGLKFTASTQSPKGVKKVDQKDRQRWQAELDRRQSIQDRFFYRAKGMLKAEEDGAQQDLDALSLPSKSPDQLQEEMRRWVAGEDDWHDRVVNEYKSRVTARHEAEQEERRRRAALLRKRLEHQEADGDLPTTPLIGYTQEQLAALLEKRSPGAPGARRVIQGSQFGKQAHLYERYLKRQASSGLLTPELEVKEGTDLTDEIAGRSVPFSSDAGD